MRGIFRSTLGLAAILILGACTSGAGDRTAEPALGDLEGRTFVSTGDTTGPDGEPLVKGTDVNLTFAADSVSASAGCNTMSGPISVQDGVLILDGGLATTEMGCDPARMGQDQWLAELLSAEPKLSVDATSLTLESKETVITLTDLDLLGPDARSSTSVER